MNAHRLGSSFVASLAVFSLAGVASAQSPSGSLLVTGQSSESSVDAAPTHELRDRSMFAIAEPEPRDIQVHDLVQIIVRESSRAASKHELETAKDYNLDGSIDGLPAFSLADLVDLQLRNSDSDNFPINVGVDFSKEFEGEGDYKRSDDLTARLTAEVIEVLPNGNMVIEARTFIKNDDEEMTIKVTGICRQEDVTFLNTILSNQIHDLKIVKMHEGELRKANEKGLIAQVLDFVFAF